MMQLKVTNSSCNIHEDFQKAIKVCYSPYGYNQEDTLDYNPAFRNYTNEMA